MNLIFRLYLAPVLKNAENKKKLLLFSEDYYCYLNLVFFMFLCFSGGKKKLSMFSVFLLFPLFFRKKKFKNYNQSLSIYFLR